jgi:hypothetical protein
MGMGDWTLAGQTPEAAPRGYVSGGGLVPVPDPTALTTAQLLREIANTREIIETRITGMDRAIELLQKMNDGYPALMDAKVGKLQEVHEEKFNSIAIQFAERDKRTEQLSLADKTAIAAALQAQKEAAGAQNESNTAANVKTETNFAKLIEQGQTLLLEVRRNTEAQINDLKSRLDKGEGHSRGLGDGWAYLLAAASLALLAGDLFLKH